MNGVLSKHTMTARARLRHPDDEVTAAYKVGTNTLRYSTSDGCGWIALHDVDILRFWPDGRIDVDTGGWTSPLTLRRIATFLPPWAEFHHDGSRLKVTTVNGVAFFKRRAWLSLDAPPKGDIETDK